MELAARQIGDGEMSHIDIPRCPRALAFRVGVSRECGSKDGELVAEALAVGGGEVARPVPPFVAKVGMRAVVFGKMELARQNGAREAIIVGPRPERIHHRERGRFLDYFFSHSMRR